MNHGAVNLLATLICLTSIGWCQSSPSSQNTLPPGHAPQQNDQRTVTVPPPNGASQFSADSSTCSPANNDRLPSESSKNTDPHAKPPRSLPATTAPGTTTPCVDSTGTEKTPAGANQAAPSGGTAPRKPEPKKQDNAVPLASPNQTSVAVMFFGSGRSVQ